MSNKDIIAKIKAEIERRMDKHWEGLPNADAPEDDWTHNELCELGAYKELEHLETFLSTLESEKPIPNDLEEAAREYTLKHSPYGKNAFIAGAKWQAKQLLKGSPMPEDTVLFNKGVEEGKRLAEEEQADLFTIVALDAAQRAREQMMKDGIEGEICHLGVDFLDYNISELDEYIKRFKVGDKVRIIIVKE